MTDHLFTIFNKSISTLILSLVILSMVFVITSCGGGGGGPALETPAPDPVNISGGGIKGPLANAVVTVYVFNASQPGFKGGIVASASTDANAVITGLLLPSPVMPPYIMELTSTPGTTTDLSTGLFPVITTLRTVITQSLLDTGEQIYATPLTTMAVDIAVRNSANTNGTAGIQADEFEAALTAGASEVVSTVGFGMSGDIDIFDTPPLVDNTTVTSAELNNVAAYRTAVEALTAIAFAMESDAASGSVDSMLAELTEDLSSDGLIDGNIDGVQSTVYSGNSLNIFKTDPLTLVIPNTTILISEVETFLADEAAVFSPTIDTTALTDGSIDPVVETGQPNPDLDNDLIFNSDDNCPIDANTDQIDTDGDTEGDVCDTDDDNDATLDVSDAFPLDETESIDTDGDGTGNNADTDDDNDGVLDDADIFPLDATESIDTDGDGTGNNADTDDDNDGVVDDADIFPLDAAESVDTDGDGIGNNADTDDDNDGVVDSADAFPLDLLQSIDITGVWDFTFTTSNPADDNQPGCSGSAPGDIQNFIMTIKQTGVNFEIASVDGTKLSAGTIDAATGFMIINGTLSDTIINLADVIDPKFETVTTNRNVKIVATATTGGTITGNATSANQSGCTLFQDVSATFVYRHTGTGTENYNGVYAFESEEFREESDNLGVVATARDGFPFELEFVDDITIAPLQRAIVYLPEELGPNQTRTITANTFDPQTGYFTVTINFTEKEEFNPANDGFDFSRQESLTVHGIFVGDPATTPGMNGSPVVLMSAQGFSYGYDGDFDAGDTLSQASNSYETLYGKRLTTSGFTRTDLVEKGDQSDVSQIRLGLLNPPLKRSDSVNSKLFLQVLDAGMNILCEGPFANNGTGPFLYTEQINQPDPDFATMQFRNGPYSSANCNTSDVAGNDQVIDGATYKIRIIDTGSNGVKDTANQATAEPPDDIIQFDSEVDLGGYQAEVVDPAERHTQTPMVFDISVNGASTSKTLGGSVLPLYGYFDTSEDITVSWPAQQPITTNYQLRVQNPGDFIVDRYNTSGLGIVIPANSLEEFETTLRLHAKNKATSSAPNSQSRAISRRIALRRGVYGLFNIELGSVIVEPYRVMQIGLESNDSGPMLCGVTNNPNVFCTGGFVDYATDTVTLNMIDITGDLVGAGAPFTLVLHFKADGVTITSAQAVVTSPNVPGIPSTVDANPANWVTSARAVNPELEIRSQRFSNGSIQSLVVGINPLGDSVYDRAIFMSDTTSTIFTNNFSTDTDTLSTSEVLWDNSVFGEDFSNKVYIFTVVPTDDNKSQITGRFAFYRTAADWGYGFGNVLKADTYVVIVQDTDGTEADVIFRKDYAGNDPSAYIAPTLDDVDVVLVNAETTTNCTAGSSCEETTPVSTGAEDASSFNLVWTAPTSPVGSHWRLIVANLATGEVVRTVRMIPDAIDSDVTSVSAGGMTTYTWINPGDIVAPSGQTLEINISVSSSEAGSEFSNLGVMIPLHRIHVTQ